MRGRISALYAPNSLFRPLRVKFLYGHAYYARDGYILRRLRSHLAIVAHISYLHHTIPRTVLVV
jgi:hypothetical protein